MKNSRTWMVTAGLAAVVLVGSAGGRLAADDFRVENKIYVGSEKEPSSRSTTIFYDGLVYDFLVQPAEITVFDKAHGRFILLDTAGKLRTELPTDQIAALNEKLKAWAAEQKDTFVKFMSNPEFTEEFDKSAGVLKFESPWVTYRVTVVDAQSAAIAQQYREFSDWYMKLNTRINPGAKLPFARLAVNAVLEKRREVPREVELSMRPKRVSFQRINVRSEHQLSRTLVESDRQRVTQAMEAIAGFDLLEFDQYQKRLKSGQ
jgi:hypothetical protein